VAATLVFSEESLVENPFKFLFGRDLRFSRIAMENPLFGHALSSRQEEKKFYLPLPFFSSFLLEGSVDQALFFFFFFSSRHRKSKILPFLYEFGPVSLSPTLNANKSIYVLLG